jgi:hypothetical protein
MPALPTSPAYSNPTIGATALSGTGAITTGTISTVATYGFNLNFIGAVLFPQIASTFTALQASLINIDASNPAALLQVQLLMSEYENAVQSTSALYASWQTLLKAIIQNI